MTLNFNHLIGNYYGTLSVREVNGIVEWGIEDYDGTDFEPIPQYLFEALVKWHEESTNG